jgi:hypothetical protein
MKSIPWVWVIVTALVTMFAGPKVMALVAKR